MTSQATGLSSIRPLSNVNDIISDEVYNCSNLDGDIPSTLSKLKIKNVDTLILYSTFKQKLVA